MNRETEYKKYSGSVVLSTKNEVRRILKSSRLGQKVYPFSQRCWRAYAIPKRRRRLQRHGASALDRLHRLMQRYKVPYYCDYGTLLGLVREQGFIKNDDDIDISIQPNAITPQKLLQIFIAAGYGFIHGFHYEGRVIEFTVIDLSGISIDIFFPVAIGGGKIHGYQPTWYPERRYPGEKANTLIEYDLVEAVDLEAITVLSVEVQVPSNYDAILTSEYGAWRMPDPEYDTVTGRKHRELPGFAFRLTQEEILAYERPALSE